ncbi:MAG TPA: 16S rRNA (guanine(527)-N(7))-methyltransferase RsmG [bacterium]|nr:16S rRNA (guanine(527)-N(7))-methyltransferase RsmG [bacterium]
MLAELYQRHQAAFDRYQSLLLKWNEKINLTAITSPNEIAERHFQDSLALIPALQAWGDSENVSRETFSEGLSLLDLGAGGGFPGIPLKIAMPSWKVTLVDSVKKKCDFMKEVVRSLALSDVEIRHQALEPNQPLGPFDLVITRAAFSLTKFLELGALHLNPSGRMVAYKGMEIEAEIKEAEETRLRHQLSPFKSYIYRLPVSKAQRQLIMTQSLS